MRPPPRDPLIEVSDWNEWHERLVLTGGQVVDWVAHHDVVVRAIEVDLHPKMKRTPDSVRFREMTRAYSGPA